MGLFQKSSSPNQRNKNRNRNVFRRGGGRGDNRANLLDGNSNNGNGKGKTGDYKGFNTSITHIFADPSSSRVDCCSLVCCGILQSDYNRFILHNRRPPTFKNRIVQYILIPLAMFCVAGYCAVTVRDRNVNEMVVWMLLTMTVGWVLGGCFRSTWRHAVVRRDLLRKVSGMGRGVVVDSQDEMEIDQSEREMTCVHRMCGCYGTDLPNEERFGGGRNRDTSGSTTPTSTSYLSCLSKTLASLCCGRLFSCHWQICGICGVAQEGRQIDALVPINRRRFDYVTFQSYFDYMNPIRKLRADENGEMWDHFMALSKLSRMMVKTLFVVTFVLGVFSVVVAPKSFRWTNLLVFIGTFAQAFLILYFVHWYWNRFDISLDAVIKYFACGFIITTSTAICFELLEAVILNIGLKILALVIDLDFGVEQNYYGYKNEDGNGGQQRSRGLSFDSDTSASSSPSASLLSFFDNLLDGGFGDGSDFHFYSNGYGYQSSNTYSEYGDRKKAFQKDYPILAILSLFLNAYMIAALVEESCKYFGFKMVEHPDFVSDSELENAVALGVFDDDDDENDYRFECGGGLDFGEDDDYDYNDNGDHYGDLERTSSKREISSRFIDGSVDGIADETSEERRIRRAKEKARAQLQECPARSLCSKGAGITVAMVSVALGFATCENLIYIFFYNQGPIGSEVAVLLSRSLFPVHPLCAAIQSINVCKQQLENDKSLGIGRIIFPAIMLHGSYDFFIMLFDFLSTMNGGDEENNNNNDDDEAEDVMSIIYSLCAFAMSVLFVIIGTVYYVRESRAQKARLEHLDSSKTFLCVV